MRATYRLVVASLMVLHVSLIAAAQQPSLADIARETRAKRESVTGALVLSSVSQVEAKDPKYRRDIQGFLARSAFAELEAAADSVRTSKDRVEGGTWKLYVFYDTVANPVERERASTVEWKQHIARLQNWATAQPQSITPRVALAEAYRSFGWKARGNGYADTVSASGAQQFGEQGDLALTTLVDAAKLSAKCPHWYFVMLEVARDQGWNPERTRALFDQAIAFEPAYYHYYREYAYNLLPKWNGQPGQAEKFADESYQRIGGRQGAFVYFEIATVLYCMCYEGKANPTLSWPILKEGFAEVEERYGATTLKLNRFALLAYLYRDRDVTKRTLERVGEQWEPTLWRQMETFNTARTWAGLPRL
jgi:hypothetical protein